MAKTTAVPLFPLALIWGTLGLISPAVQAQDAPDGRQLVQVVREYTAPLVEDLEEFGYRLTGARSAGADEAVTVALDVTGASTFSVRIRSEFANATLTRSADRTVLALPDHQVAFVGEGPLDDDGDVLAPLGFVERLLGDRAALAPVGRAAAVSAVRSLEPQADGWRLDDDSVLALSEDGAIIATSAKRRGFIEGFRQLELTFVDDAAQVESSTAGLKIERVDRREFERMLFRGVRRLLSIQAPEVFGITRPKPRQVPHGELREVDGQLLALLDGTPEQIGTAHGLLLGDLARHTIDSTLYLVGMVETVRTGKWFMGVLDDAWRRLSPHVPDRHKREMAAMAAAVPQISLREVELGNVFPEYFHCSGFAVFGDATAGGELYHGRVLDYMTLIGLQHAAVTQVVRPNGYHSFLNVGYACFIGSVSGMNDQKISLGEMGGGGRFLWDGVPMATLMRRALEECSTLSEVKRLWQDNPRTCEYYYVFADGKIPDAVAMKAVPEGVTFVAPGEAHELLGPGIKDAVVLSSGSRLELLRERVQQQYGAIDEQAAIRLMDRPVAMSSNLHNVLFVPQRGVVWIAHADGAEPAAEQPYVRYDLDELLRSQSPRTVFDGADTLAPKPERDEDAREFLETFLYEPTTFEARTTDEPGEWDAIVRFPSPRPSGDERNDEVVMEWYQARERGRVLGARPAPAVLLMHILDGRFRVARGFARALSREGVHAFVMHQPYYGWRGTREQRRRHDLMVPRCRQAVADARRAHDAIAALPGIDQAHIAIQGTSLGGFITTLTASLDDAFDQVFIALAGADLYSMFSTGGQDAAKIRRSLRAAGYDDQRMKTLLWAIDPIRVAHRLRPDRTWLYTAMFDQVVPAACGAALGRVAGLEGEHHVWLPGGHYSAAVFIPRMVHELQSRMLIE